MRRLAVNATAAEIASAVRGPITWDVAFYGGLLSASWEQLTVTDLGDARRLRGSALSGARGHRSAPAADEPARLGPSVPLTSPIGPLSPRERWLRVALRTDVIVGLDADAIVTHLRFARTVPRRLPVVYSTTGIVPATWEWRATTDAEAIRTKDVRVEAALCGRADLVLCWTAYGADNLGRLGGVATRKIQVVPPVLPLAEPAGAPLAPSDRVRVVFVGEAAVLKGLPELLDAVAAVDGVELHVIGPPPPAQPPPRTVWHGRLAPGRVARFVADGDVFALPTHQESYGVSFLEAMRASTAVLATNLGTVVELVGDGGTFVPPGDVDALTMRLRELTENPAMRDELAAAGQRRYVERFSPDVTAPRLERAITSAW